MVWATDPITGESGWKPVTSLFTNIPKLIYIIELDVEGKKQIIESTDDHPFYVVGKGWIKTVNLQPDYQIQTKDGLIITVTSVELTDQQDVTYNFTVDDFHTYYVTEYGVLVHNAKPCGKKDGTPGNNQAQNKQFNDATQGLTKYEKRLVHEEITGQNFDFHDIKELTDEIIRNRKR